MDIFEKVVASHMNVLLLIGLALFGGTFGGRLFQKIRIPQVVGYIAIGIVIGASGFKLIDAQTLDNLDPINSFALGLIGFTLGNELRLDVFKKFGKQFIYILFFEALAAFAVVAVLSLVAGVALFPFKTALGFALLFGPISAATAAAGTTDVLNEYKAKGLLTTTILGIVALDDILALLLFAVFSSVAGNLLGHEAVSLGASILEPLYEIGGSIALGTVSGFLLSGILNHYTEEERALNFSIGAVLFILGLAVVLKVDMIMASMIMGAIFANRVPKRSKSVFRLIDTFSPPIYVLFFVFVGAKFNLSVISLPIAVFIGVFLVGRSAGKMLGAYTGAKLSGAAEKVRKYLPLCLFSQSGVAIGLSIIASQKFPGEIGSTILIVVTTTTFVVQLLSPPFLRSAIKASGEAGRNITETDLIRSIAAKDVMRKLPVIREGDTLETILKIFADNDGLSYAVVDKRNSPIGCVTIESIKGAFGNESLSGLLLAADVMEEGGYVTKLDTSVEAIKHEFATRDIEAAPVMDKDGLYAGFIENRYIQQFVSRRMLELEATV